MITDYQMNADTRNPPPRKARCAALAILLGTALAALAPAMLWAEDTIIKKWAIAEFGEPLYAGGLEHFPYTNPNAPKGGKIVLSDFGSFDTLNFYVQKGEWPGTIGNRL